MKSRNPSGGAKTAIADSEIAIAKTPDNRENVKAMLALARTERRLGNDTAACGHLRAAILIDPANLQVLRELAAVLRDLDRREEAASIYRRILAGNPDDAPSKMGLGWIALADHNGEAARGYFSAAAACLRVAAEAQPNNLGARAQLAAALSELDQSEEAASIFRSILETSPGHAPAHTGLGRIARKSGNDGAALAHFKAACELNPLDLQPKITLGRVLAEMQRFEEAEASYRLACEQAPNHAQIRLALGKLAGMRRNWEGALEQFTAAVEHNPGSTPARLGLGGALRELARWDDAERIYRSILEDSPRNAEALLGLGKTANGRGDKEAALAFSEAAATAAPLDLRPKQLIRRLKKVQAGNDWRTELEDALAVVQSTSAPVETQLEAAEVLVKHGLTEAARPVLTRLEARLPGARQLLLAARQIERMGLAQTLSSSPDGSGPPQNQLDALTGFTEMPVPDADTLLIVFAGAGNRFSISLSLLHRILRKTGVSIIYCRDPEEAYYTRGVVGLGNDFHSTVDGFRTLAARYGAKRILTLGHCVGVQGALRFGLFLEAQGVLGLGPRLASDSLRPVEQTRLAELSEQLPANFRTMDSQYLEAAARPNVDLFFGEHYGVDSTGTRSMAAVPGVTVTGIPHSADTVKDLLVRGLLEPLLIDFVANGAVSPEVRALISNSGDPQPVR